MVEAARCTHVSAQHLSTAGEGGGGGEGREGEGREEIEHQPVAAGGSRRSKPGGALAPNGVCVGVGK